MELWLTGRTFWPLFSSAKGVERMIDAFAAGCFPDDKSSDENFRSPRGELFADEKAGGFGRKYGSGVAFLLELCAERNGPLAVSQVRTQTEIKQRRQNVFMIGRVGIGFEAIYVSER